MFIIGNNKFNNKMKMAQIIIMISTALFNIAGIITGELGFQKATEVLSMIAPEVNIVLVGVLWFLGYKENKELHNIIREELGDKI